MVHAIHAALLQLFGLLRRKQPQAAQIFRLYCDLILGTIVVIASISRFEGPRAEITMQ